MKLNGEIRVRHQLLSEKAIRDLVHEELWVKRQDIRFGRFDVGGFSAVFGGVNYYIDDPSDLNPHEVIQPILLGSIATEHSMVNLIQYNKQKRLDIRSISSCCIPDRIDFVMFGCQFSLYKPIVIEITHRDDLEEQVKDIVETLWGVLNAYFEKNSNSTQSYK